MRRYDSTVERSSFVRIGLEARQNRAGLCRLPGHGVVSVPETGLELPGKGRGHGDNMLVLPLGPVGESRPSSTPFDFVCQDGRKALLAASTIGVPMPNMWMSNPEIIASGLGMGRGPMRESRTTMNVMTT